MSFRRLAGSILEPIFELEALVARSWASAAHRRLMFAQWRLGAPKFFDHHIDLFYQWGAHRSSLWLERGIFSGLALKGGDVLELACGDGFNARNFYSLRSRTVVACDFDPIAIRTAIAKNSAPNVSYVLADIRTDMPEGSFGNVIWDAALEPFTPAEIESLMATIKSRLTPDGILSGYAVVEYADGSYHHAQSLYEFKDMGDLARFLSPHFKNVRVFEIKHPGRHNLYFWASDAVLPFDPKWQHSLSLSK